MKNKEKMSRSRIDIKIVLVVITIMALAICIPTSYAKIQKTVIISSVQFDAPGSDSKSNLNEEWVKITNKGTKLVDMKNWKLSDRGYKHKYVFPSFILKPGKTVTVRTGSGKNSQTDLYMNRGAHMWNNKGDTATLIDNNGKIIDQVSK